MMTSIYDCDAFTKPSNSLDFLFSDLKKDIFHGTFWGMGIGMILGATVFPSLFLSMLLGSSIGSIGCVFWGCAKKIFHVKMISTLNSVASLNGYLNEKLHIWKQKIKKDEINSSEIQHSILKSEKHKIDKALNKLSVILNKSWKIILSQFYKEDVNKTLPLSVQGIFYDKVVRYHQIQNQLSIQKSTVGTIEKQIIQHKEKIQKKKLNKREVLLQKELIGIMNEQSNMMQNQYKEKEEIVQQLIPLFRHIQLEKEYRKLQEYQQNYIELQKLVA